MKRLLSVLILAAALPAASAQAQPLATATHHGGVSWSGQTWHVASGTFKSGQRNCPSHVSFGSSLTIKVYGMCGGGVGSTLNRHQGKWSVTFKDTRGAGKYAILLWPENGSRPEVDFAEDKRGDSQRVLTTGTYHPKPGCNSCIHSKISGDFTRFHTASVVWTSKGFTLLMDGKAWAHYPGGWYGGRMHVSIHNEAWGDSGSSTLTVSHVSVG
jgi:hypothetical protein